MQLSASVGDEKSMPKVLVEIRLRHHPHESFWLYFRLPARGDLPSPLRPPPNTLAITSRPSGSLQIAFPHHLPLAARPPLTHTLQPPRVPSPYNLGPSTCYS